MLVLGGLLYAAVVTPIAIHKSGDLVAELGQSERLLRGERLYGSANPVQGVWWPPFSALALAPLALVARWSVAAAKGVWAVLGVACLVWSVACIARVRTAGWIAVALALAAVAVPIQTNFEHGNINVVLLALIVAGVAELGAARESRAGVWLGIATALKAFPALLLLHLAFRRRWRACGVGVATALGLTAVALLPFGPSGALASVGDWLAQGEGSYGLVRSSNQSLAALVSRLGGSPAAAVALSVALLLLAAIALSRRRAPDAPAEAGAVTLLAVVTSPIAWVHYYCLLFPAWVDTIVSTASAGGGRLRRVALLLAAIATSGLLTVGPRSLRVAVLDASAYTWGALIVLTLFLLRRPRAPQPRPAADA